MLELFSSPDAAINLGDDDELATIAVSDDMLSLSAILLEKDYYEALVASRRTLDGIHVLDETLLIPFKARAFVDLTRRREEGQKVKGSDIKKHRNDVFRLLQLLTPTSTIEVSEPLKNDLRAYTAHLDSDESFRPKDFDVPFERDEGYELLSKIYRL